MLISFNLLMISWQAPNANTVLACEKLLLHVRKLSLAILIWQIEHQRVAFLSRFEIKNGANDLRNKTVSISSSLF